MLVTGCLLSSTRGFTSFEDRVLSQAQAIPDVRGAVLAAELDSDLKSSLTTGFRFEDRPIFQDSSLH